MNTSRLVYLHIEKSAGTSQRELFYSVYGKEQVFWYGIQSNARVLNEAEWGDCAVVGGHRPYLFYRSAESSLIFASVVREPVARALSLFNYYARSPIADRASWQSRGLDPDSLIQTLERCPDFVAQISNAQCHYLSGFSSFDAARETLNASPFIVASFEQLAAFNEALARALAWGKLVEMPFVNVGGRGYQDALLNHPEVRGLLSSLNEEDTRLHDYLRSEVVFESERALSGLVPMPPPNPRPDQRREVEVAAGLVMRLIDPASSISASAAPDAEDLVLRVSLENRSRWALSARGSNRFVIGYRVFNSAGNVVGEGPRTALADDLAAGESIEQELRINARAFGGADLSYIRIAVLREGVSWLDNLCREHGIEIPARDGNCQRL